jgi:hypothetical protein
LTTPQTIAAPAGWTITAPTVSTLLVNHGQSVQPSCGFVYGQVTGGASYASRSLTASFNILFTSYTSGSCTIEGVSSTSTGAGTGLSAIIILIF